MAQTKKPVVSMTLVLSVDLFYSNMDPSFPQRECNPKRNRKQSVASLRERRSWTHRRPEPAWCSHTLLFHATLLWSLYNRWWDDALPLNPHSSPPLPSPLPGLERLQRPASPHLFVPRWRSGISPPVWSPFPPACWVLARCTPVCGGEWELDRET